MKTFVQRLNAMAVLLGGKIAERDHGLPEHARLNFWSEVKLVPRFMASAPVDTVTRVLLRALAWMACRSDRVVLGAPIPDLTVVRKLDEVVDLLKQKNASYGNTALEPVRTFSSGSAVDLLYARADDKLNRLRTAETAFEEDALLDMAGYLVLILLALEDQANIRAAKSAEAAEQPEEYRDLDSSCGE